MVLYILHALILCLHAHDWLSCLEHTVSPLLVAAYKPPAAARNHLISERLHLLGDMLLRPYSSILTALDLSNKKVDLLPSVGHKVCLRPLHLSSNQLL
jgi:hypothetical protein